MSAPESSALDVMQRRRARAPQRGGHFWAQSSSRTNLPPAQVTVRVTPTASGTSIPEQTMPGAVQSSPFTTSLSSGHCETSATPVSVQIGAMLSEQKNLPSLHEQNHQGSGAVRQVRPSVAQASPSWSDAASGQPAAAAPLGFGEVTVDPSLPSGSGDDVSDVHATVVKRAAKEAVKKREVFMMS